MSLANSDSEDSMFGSEEFGSEIDSGMGFGDADGGFMAPPPDQVAIGAPVVPALHTRQLSDFDQHAFDVNLGNHSFFLLR